MRPFRLFGLLAPGLLAASLASGAGGPAPSLVELVDRFEKLQLANDSAAVANLKLTSEHLECVLTTGRAAYVKAGDEVVGVFFEGNGTMEYTSVDPIEAPVVTYVTKKSSSLSPEKTDKGVRIRDKFSRFLWLVAGEKVPELTGLGPTPLSAGFQGETFSKRRGAPRGFGFALQRFNAPTAPYVWVEMEGGKEDLLYVRDGMENPSESLSSLRPSGFHDAKLKDSLFPVTLSDQPLVRDRRDPPRARFGLIDVDLDLKASDDKDVEMTVVETVVPQKDPVSVFRFDLDSAVWTTVGEHLATRTERLRKVTDEAGRSLGFYHQNGLLLVQMAGPVPAGTAAKLRFEIDGDFLVHPGGDSYWDLGVWSWFPQPRLCEQFYTFHSVVHVKKPFVPFAPGVTVRRSAEGDDNVLETKVENPIQFAVVLAGKYDFKEEVRDGVTIRVATYALKNDRAVKQLTDLAAAIIGFYKEFLGPFPFPEFNIIEINDYGFGQAPPGTMFITKEAFNPLGGTVENQLYSGGVNERFAHEIAHQYWGHVVKMPSDEEQWLSESFAEYCAALFIKAAKGDAHYKLIVGHWKGGARFATDKAPIPLANRVSVANDATTQYAIRTGLLYQKGPLLLAALHRELGDDAFLTFLKSYQKSFRWKFGSTKTVQGLLQFMTKKDYGPFFEENYWGLGMPKD
jgi:hypothetical protein